MNAYKDLLARYDPETLSEPFARALPANNTSTPISSPATPCRPRTQNRQPPRHSRTPDPHALPLQRDAAQKSPSRGVIDPRRPRPEERCYNISRAELAREQHHTVIGQTFTTSPSLYHAPPDPLLTLPLRDRFRHGYIIGKTGAGKTNLSSTSSRKTSTTLTLALSSFLPKMVFSITLPAIPESRKDDLIYFDPTDTLDPVIGFNPFDFTDADDLDPATKRTTSPSKRAKPTPS